jgi:hypothetical protein
VVKLLTTETGESGAYDAKSSPIQPSVKDDSASPIVGEGVTSTTEKGDIHDIEKGDTHVTPLKGTISIEPSVELVDAPASHPRRVRSSARKSDLRDGIYNAIIECWHPGQTWQDLTKSEQSLIGKIASELVEVGATAEQVPRAWQAWPRLYPRAGKCTPPTLAKHWNELVKVDAVAANGIDPERYEKRIRPDGTVGYYDR